MVKDGKAEAPALRTFQEMRTSLLFSLSALLPLALAQHSGSALGSERFNLLSNSGTGCPSSGYPWPSASNPIAFRPYTINYWQQPFNNRHTALIQFQEGIFEAFSGTNRSSLSCNTVIPIIVPPGKKFSFVKLSAAGLHQVPPGYVVTLLAKAFIEGYYEIVHLQAIVRDRSEPGGGEVPLTVYGRGQLASDCGTGSEELHLSMTLNLIPEVEGLEPANTKIMAWVLTVEFTDC